MSIPVRNLAALVVSAAIVLTGCSSGSSPTEVKETEDCRQWAELMASGDLAPRRLEAVRDQSTGKVALLMSDLITATAAGDWDRMGVAMRAVDDRCGELGVDITY